ncbi:MAG: rhomboid family intramembrane serine protease [Candidatus Acidiferrales bacterium]
MIPLKNLNPRRSFPVVTVSIIIVNALVFFFQLSLSPRALNHFIMMYGAVPRTLQLALAGQNGLSAIDAVIPLFTSMFIHGGWLHIIGNMWFLWIFGGDVEDRLGHVLYLLFYFACGLGSGLAQAAFTWGSKLPAIGASGAISGVLGAYILYYPASRILTLVPLFIIWFTARIPAWVFIGLWFFVQFFSGVSSLSSATSGGVAWWAHVGGFLLGMLLAYPKRPRHPNYYYGEA